jgi:hypothetical protein
MKMPKYQYVEPLIDHHDEPVVITVSVRWIELMYYPAWKRKMREAGHADHISLEKCIDDFSVTHWAHEV